MAKALLDEAAVLASMAYVDHSLFIARPIHAKMAKTPETSDFTSIKLHIKAAIKGEQPNTLLPFVGNESKDILKGLMFSAKEYLQLVDDTGRIVRADKRGSMSQESANILNRLNIPQENRIKLTTEFTKVFKGPVGNTQELTAYCEHLDRKRRQGAANFHRWLDSA